MNVIDKVMAMHKEERDALLKKRPKNSFTMAEYAERTGLQRSVCKKQIRRLLRIKKLKRITFPQRDEKTGYIITRQGYQLV